MDGRVKRNARATPGVRVKYPWNSQHFCVVRQGPATGNCYMLVGRTTNDYPKQPVRTDIPAATTNRSCKMNAAGNSPD